MRLSAIPRFCCALLAATLAGCASVATTVTLLDPAQKFAPTERVAILLDFPAQPHLKIALFEAQGMVGGGEAELFEAVRKKAQVLGADAIVRLEMTSTYREPVKVYDPWYANPFYSRYRYSYRPFGYYPFAYGSYPYSDYRWVGGGEVQTLKAVAIRYTEDRAQTKPAP
jgi:hypothetical protein